MALLLNIDTDAETASVSLSDDHNILAFKVNTFQKEHASFVHIAINELLAGQGKVINEIKAVSVTAGPGSYTGIRVGMATAKGLCFALDIPLIMINSLELLAHAALSETISKSIYIPVIDARRMEVYTAVYDHDMTLLESPHPLILTEDSFSKYSGQSVVFVGSGVTKLKSLISTVSSTFLVQVDKLTAMSRLAYSRFKSNNFDDPILSEPLYLKDIYMP